MIRNGIGFDAHRFEKGRRLVLGGVDIPFDRGLDGHSDADVLVHAIMDAMLGAVAEGDIGKHFPSNDPAWKDADSLKLLEHVAGILRVRRVRVLNLDSTVIAEAPMLAPHMEAMRQRIAEATGLATKYVSVKATTPEKMGALGREEGIAALAIATVQDDEP